MARSTFVDWYRALPIPWLVAGVNGKAEGGTWPSVVDAQTVLLDAARKVAYPDYAPSDALSALGGDRKLVQGPAETDANFRIRLKGVWEDWARAGTPVELLVQLYWGGWTGAVLVQQNGLAYTLSGAPTAGVDPTGLLTVTTCSSLSVALTSNVNPPTATNTGRSIPAANAWWQFAESRSANANVSDADYCNRFAVLFPGPLPSQFMTVGTATFTASDTATVTWNNAFPTTSYHVQVGAVTITDGGGPVSVVADSTTFTLTGCTLLASGAFTGTVSVLAWQNGANPYADLHPSDLSKLQFTIATWRPNALCVGVYAVAQGTMYGWTPATFSGRSAMGPSSIARYEGVTGGV
jgi:hypothetical protein